MIQPASIWFPCRLPVILPLPPRASGAATPQLVRPALIVLPEDIQPAEALVIWRQLIKNVPVVFHQGPAPWPLVSLPEEARVLGSLDGVVPGTTPGLSALLGSISFLPIPPPKIFRLQAQLVTWDNQASQQTKKHEILVAHILNSLLRQQILVQTGQDSWNIPAIVGVSGPAGASGATGATGPAAQNNEAQAAALINATSAGDAGSRADHFPGTSLNAAWSKDGVAATAIVANSVFGFVSTDATSWVKTYTPTGILRVETRIIGLTNPAALMIHDSSSTSGGNGMVVQLEGTTINLISQDAGSYTNRAQVTIAGTGIPWVYLALARGGSNDWTGYYSADRCNWVTIGTYSKTFTVGKIGLQADRSGTYVSCDFVDVVL